ncbi:MAG: NYN domain-containing protein [Gammaproteobacteria bacterium]|nr:NYN domain-containing protein [Gammaproteobacteria bacterium]MBT3725735.1 NYN domain-containing protein [Gammaproteobacteria bacterium]MBT4074956.1 NYN domain-containing protein [Gammaproteobacteria bacterium]MBT4194776.1 NYN domain-containing protein [Gammaproteobacteria bacterium]MBT4448586.1 NYN domain-containing protein [Gammaproteobacteria bacterium]
MRTNIYIDGYNLYYGRLKHTDHKWLDIKKLFEHILKIQSPKSSINKIKYFTADIKSKVASHGQVAQQAQNNYNRALELLYPDYFEIIKGYYSLDFANLPIYQKPPDKSQRAKVWRLEEKQTDVNIALHMYRDVVKTDCDQIVLVSNDTDLEPALEAIREDKGNSVQIGVIIPIEKQTQGKRHRPANQRLSQYADWTRHHILDDELASSQLPLKIPTNKKPIIKPNYW